MKMRFYLLIIFSSYPLFLFGQKHLVSGKVTEMDSIPLPAASIKLYNLNKELITQTVSNSDGDFTIFAPNDSCNLIVSLIGYISSFKTISETTKKITINLIPINQQLSEVVVKGQKPFIEQDFGKLIVNIDGNSKVGINAIEILKRVPGTVVNDQSIRVEGQSIRVFIDNKPTLLNGKDLINMLNGMSVDQLKNMEVIYNPSSKYDAEGKGGIININTLKRTQVGYNGSVNGILGFGWKYPLGNSGINLSFKTKKINTYGSYYIADSKQYQEVLTNRNLNNQKIDDTSIIETPYLSQNLRLGLDYFYNKNNIIGFLFTGLHNSNNPLFNSTSYVYNQFYNLDSTKTFINQNHSLSKGGNLNLNVRHNFDSLGKKKLTIDLDGGKFKYLSDDNINQNTIINSLPNNQEYFLQQNSKNSSIYSLKSDFSSSNKSIVLESGIKISYVSINNLNNSDFNNTTHDEFKYNETILASYLNYKFSIKKACNIQLGIRAEKTISKGNSITLDSIVNRKYLNLFPSITLQYKLKQGSITSSYSRRIERPDYSYLNPFSIIKSAYYISSGNPFLKPAFTQNFRINYSLNHLSFSTSYVSSKDVISDLESQNDSTKIVLDTKANLNWGKVLRLSASYNNLFFKILELNYSTGYYNNAYKFSYTDKKIHLNQDGFFLMMDNKINVSKKWYFDVFYYRQSRTTYGNRIDLPYWNISLSGGKSIFQNKGNLSFSFNDIFFTNITRSKASYSNLDMTIHSKYDSRSFRINFTYKFGQSKYGYQNRTPGSNEEQHRNF